MPASQQLLDLAGRYRDESPSSFAGLKGDHARQLRSWNRAGGSRSWRGGTTTSPGMKYRGGDAARSRQKVRYQAHDGVDDYCAFDDDRGLRRRLLGVPRAFGPTEGWRRAGRATPRAFIAFVGADLVGRTAPTPAKVLTAAVERAEAMLEEGAHPRARRAGHFCDGCGTGESRPAVKPTVVASGMPTSQPVEPQRRRISTMIVSPLAPPRATSRRTISHSKHGRPRTSAHYIVGRDGSAGAAWSATATAPGTRETWR